MSIEELYKKRRQIRAAWDPNRLPSKDLIYDLLKRTQNIAPSKHNLYPFKIHAFGPNNIDERKKLEQICCQYTQGAVHEFNTSHEHFEASGKYYNSSPWMLVFELRKCEPNTFIKEYDTIFQGESPNAVKGDFSGAASRFSQISENRFRENNNKTLACIEVGMYVKLLAGLCLENDLAISYIRGYPEWNWKGQRKEYSKDINQIGLSWDSLPEITEAPLLVVQIGYKADMDDPLASTVEVDGVVYSTNGGIVLEDKPGIDEIVQFKD